MKKFIDILSQAFSFIETFAHKSVGFDGILHIIVPCALVDFFDLFLPFWVSALIVLVISVLKELVYDKALGKGECSWKDFYCDVAGIILGVL